MLPGLRRHVPRLLRQHGGAHGGAVRVAAPDIGPEPRADVEPFTKPERAAVPFPERAPERAERAPERGAVACAQRATDVVAVNNDIFKLANMGGERTSISVRS